VLTLSFIPNFVEICETAFPGRGAEISKAFCVVADAAMLFGIALGVSFTLAVQKVFRMMLESDWYNRRKNAD
jgi:hypothetical protein